MAGSSPDAAFTTLDGELPLLLLPVRIETRLQLDRAPRRLLVRVVPDGVHADTHDPALEPGEVSLGEAFWRGAWADPTDRDAARGAAARVVARLGERRAAWTLEATRPVNWALRQTRSTAGNPRFPAHQPKRAAVPGLARLLPERFAVVGYQNRERVFVAFGAPVLGDLAVAPDFAALPGAAPRSIADLLAAQGVEWMRDFSAAVAAGMGLRIDLPATLHLEFGLDVLVCGACRGDPDDTAQALGDLLAARHWTHGVGFVRRGTATNTTDATVSGLAPSEPDVSALLDTALTLPPVPAGAAATPRTPLSRRTFGAAAASALGLPAGSILERVPLHDDAQLDLAAAMTAALWPATWGFVLRSLLGRAVTPDDIAWAHDLAIDAVRGGGTLPTFRIGVDPYGLLPVMLEGRGDRLQPILLDLLGFWDDALQRGAVAHLDPDATDLTGTRTESAPTLDEAAAALARILGATPNPGTFGLRAVEDDTGAIELRWLADVALLDVLLGPQLPDLQATLAAQLDAATTLEAQITVFENAIQSGGAEDGTGVGALWFAAHDGTATHQRRDAAQQALDRVQDTLLPDLYAHRDRAAPLLDLGVDRTAVTALITPSGEPTLFYASSAAGAPAPVTASSAGDDPATWLAALAAQAVDPSQTATGPGPHPPLLFQMLKRSLAVATAADAPALTDGLRTLAGAAADGRLPDPEADLELLVREVLGTCTHRIDAWLSAQASQRLAAMRARRPTGIGVGACGWVLNLRPASAESPTQGFIHAPSLDHAVAAGVLRSGWSALGDGVAVDVSSARARTASWVIGGLRDGQELPDLLGRALERRLHDAHLDDQVEPLRVAVLGATGRPGAPASAVVDGLVVARAWAGDDAVVTRTDEERAVAAALQRLVLAAGDEAGALRAVLTAHAAELDAVADATLLDAVYALVRGAPDQASATLGGDGEPPPQLEALRTPRSGQRITHRLLLAFDAPATASAGVAPDAIAEPAVDAWLAGLLPLERVVYGVSGEPRPRRLADAGLGPLELVEAAATGDGGALTARLSFAAARGRGDASPVAIDPMPTATAPDELPLGLFLAAARAVRAVLGSGRAATPADLAAAGDAADAVDGVDGADGVDAAAVAARAGALLASASTSAKQLRSALAGPTDELLDATGALAAWRIPGTPPDTGLAAAELADAAGAALAALDARVAAHDAVSGDDLRASLARIDALLPGALVVPPVAAADPAGLAASAASSATRLGGAGTAVAWLHQAGRVRDGARAAADAVDLAEAAGAPPFAPLLVQLPDHPEEGWAATSVPTADAAPRTCLLWLRPPDDWTHTSAVLVDGWTEVVPAREATTGIAVHFDGPSSKAPQALLLALQPAGGTWSLEAVLQLLLQTIDRTRQRAVAPEDLQGLGQYLPAAYLAANTDPGPAPSPA